MANKKALEKIKQQLASFQTIVASMKQLFNDDGVISKEEQVQIMLLESSMNKVKAKLKKITAVSSSDSPKKDLETPKDDKTVTEEKKIKVPKGATLKKLAKKYNVSTGNLKSWNADKLKTWGDIIGFNAGEIIIVQKGSDTKTSSTPTPTPVKSTTPAPADTAPKSDTDQPQTAPKKPTEEKTIKVPKGWGLERLAKKYNVSPSDLKSWNADKLKTWGDTIGFNAGETIVIQKGGDTKTSSNPTPVKDTDNTPAKDTDSTPKTDTDSPKTPVGTKISKSVGKKGANVSNDVLIVQKLLKDTWDYDVPQTGEVENNTLQAIAKFQHRFAGMITKQDTVIDPDGTTWKYLTGQLKPTLKKQDDGTLAGAETEIEKKLAEFTKNVSDIEIEISKGEIVTVRPPYHMNNKDRRTVINATRKANPAVNKIITKMGWNDSHGKATPSTIKKFLEDCIAKGFIKDKSSTGLNQFLDKFAITMDCSGLAIQSVNFLHEGNMERESNKTETVQITNAANIKSCGTKINAPKHLKAGDMMVNGDHVRVITDVDISGNVVAFSTVESSPTTMTGYGDGVGDSGDGVGERRWKFENGAKFENCQLLRGNKWGLGGGGYVYRRMDAKAIAKIQAL